MAGFLYFKPNHTGGITREQLAEWGLGYAFPKAVAATLCTANTLTNTPGTVFADPERQGDRPVKLDTTAQEWRKLPRSGPQPSALSPPPDIRVGMWNDAPPTLDELARSSQIPGYRVKLADDRDWLIPLVRRFDTQQLTTVSTLPCYMECDEDGNWHRGPVLAIHAHLWEATQPVADALLAEYLHGKQIILSDAQILTAATTLLAANYCVGPGELSLMHAFAFEANTHGAIMASCDWPTFLAWSEARTDEEKKSTSPATSAGSTTSAGETGEQ